MASQPIARSAPPGWFRPEVRHRFRIWSALLAIGAIIITVAIQGYSYYLLPLAARVDSPAHTALRPSGTTGVRLGLVGLFLFLILFLYPIRKRSKRLSRIGKTKNWLDFHILAGIAAPILVTLHTSFKLCGLAGVAYWIMIAVAVSGFIGRYLYSQIPRSISSAELSLKEMQGLAGELSAQLQRQSLFSEQELAPLFRLPSREEVQSMPVFRAFLIMFWLDISRLFLVASLRRRFLSPCSLLFTLGGLLPSSNLELETIITSVRRQSWLSAKMLLLERAHRVFHLWHVVHRPFSYSFAVLITIHVGVVLLLGYY
ncbi:MAG: hypothetical protein HY235_25350 [Acidobacteria bacterium]|nr:hypothetical protein [Acidobacteriota bacterium]